MPSPFACASTSRSTSLPERPTAICSRWMSWKRFPAASPALSPGGRVGLARLEDVGKLLLVCRQSEVDKAHVAMEHVAGQDRGARSGPALPGPPEGSTGRLDVDRRREPGLQTGVVHRLAHPPDRHRRWSSRQADDVRENASAMIWCPIATMLG